MPARSNDFQRLVFLVKKVLSGTGATVTESKFLTDLHTGHEREVDVCIDAEVGGHPVVICIECRDHQRPADVPWVEQMKSKHDRLPTSTLVLASRSGFSKRARGLAKVAGIQLLPYKTLTPADVQQAVDFTEGLWAMNYSLTLKAVVVVVPGVDDLPPERIELGVQNACFDADGREVGGVGEMVRALLTDARIADRFHREGNESHAFFTAIITNPTFRPDRQRVFIKGVVPTILRPIDTVEIYGACRLRQARFKLTHGALGPVRVAWGSSVLDGREAMMVAVTPEGAAPTLTLHLEEPPRDPTSDGNA